MEILAWDGALDCPQPHVRGIHLHELVSRVRLYQDGSGGEVPLEFRKG